MHIERFRSSYSSFFASCFFFHEPSRVFPKDFSSFTQLPEPWCHRKGAAALCVLCAGSNVTGLLADVSRLTSLIHQYGHSAVENQGFGWIHIYPSCLIWTFLLHEFVFENPVVSSVFFQLVTSSKESIKTDSKHWSVMIMMMMKKKKKKKLAMVHPAPSFCKMRSDMFDCYDSNLSPPDNSSIPWSNKQQMYGNVERDFPLWYCMKFGS